MAFLTNKISPLDQSVEIDVKNLADVSRRSANNTFTGTNAFDGNVSLNGDISAKNMPTVGGAAIVKRGTNANGSYIQFSNGVMMCWHNINAGPGNAIGLGDYGSPYVTNNFSWTFPMPFVSVPTMTGTTGGTLNANSSSLLQTAGLPTLTGSGDMRGVSVGSGKNTYDVLIQLTAFGFWK